MKNTVQPAKYACWSRRKSVRREEPDEGDGIDGEDPLDNRWGVVLDAALEDHGGNEQKTFIDSKSRKECHGRSKDDPVQGDKALRAKFGAQGRKQRNNAETDAPGETIRRPRIMQHAEPDALVGEPNQADEKQGVAAGHGQRCDGGESRERRRAGKAESEHNAGGDQQSDPDWATPAYGYCMRLGVHWRSPFRN
jgi:hypothetical protein